MQNGIRGLLDAVYPPVCLLCGQLSAGIHPHCCPECFGSFEPIGRSCCEICGRPFAVSPVPHRCLECDQKTPPFVWCRGVYFYSGAVALALSRFKYGGRLALKTPLCAAIDSGFEDLSPVPEAELLVPVPMSAGGRWRRGYNQSHVLAVPVAGKLGIEIRSDILEKRGNRVQVGLSAVERAANAAASFVPGRNLDMARGRKIMLFDDVYTTGSTAWACARILKKGGAREVSVLTFARAEGG